MVRTAAPHIPSLDGIRAFAFLLVFAAHAGLDRVVAGGFGVTVFFFLSGYLITTLLRLEAESTGTVSLRRFYGRRALRILPPFYVVLLLAAALAALGMLPGGVAREALAAQALHVANYWVVRHGYDGQPAGTGVYWSLAVEEHFYVVFPCFYMVLRAVFHSRRKQAVVVWAMCIGVLVWRCWLVFHHHAAAERTYVASDTRVDSILFGCALAIAGNPVLDGATMWSPKVWKWVLVPLSFAALLPTFICRDAHFRETLRYSVQGIALTPLFIAAIRFPTWAPLRLLSLRGVSFLGVLSYPLYLVHHVVLSALARPLGVGLLRGSIALVASIAVSWVLHHAVEKPCARLRQRLSERTVTLRQSAASAAPFQTTAE
jgi:peptidoglycan/LPS O-acetylase OafA/YrhL